MYQFVKNRYLAAGLFVIGSLIASHFLGASAAPMSQSGNTAIHTADAVPLTYMPSTFAGKVLHWTSEGLFFESTGADPSNGKVLLGEFWMALDAQEQPTAYHARYTYLDGSLHQEIYQDQTSAILVEGGDYLRPGQLVPSGWCVTPMQVPSGASALLKYIPLFMNASQLGPAMGMRDTGMHALTLTPPVTSTLPDVKPFSQLGNVTDVNVWVSTQADATDGSQGSHQLSLGPLGRVIAQVTTGTNKDGSTSLHAWAVYGALNVYASSVVPPTIFEVPQDIGEECVG